MYKLLGLLSASSLCLVLSLTTGCSGAKEKDQKGKTGKHDAGDLAFTPASPAKIDDKTKSVKVTSNKEVTKVSPADDKGVTHEVKGKEITFSVKDLPKEEQTATFSIEAGEKKAEYKVTVPAAPKPSPPPTTTVAKIVPPPPPVEEELAPKAAMLTLTIQKGDGKASFTSFIKGKVESVAPKGEASKVFTAAKTGEKAVEVTAKGAKAGDTAEFVVTGKKGTMILTVKAAEPPPPPPPMPEFGVDGKAPVELKLDKMMKDVVETIKFKGGKVLGADVDPVGKGVTAEGKDDWVKITITPKAMPGDYTIKVRGEKKTVEIKIKVSAPTSAAVEGQEARVIIPTPRQAILSSERFVSIMNRRI